MKVFHSFSVSDWLDQSPWRTPTCFDLLLICFLFVIFQLASLQGFSSLATPPLPFKTLVYHHPGYYPTYRLSHLFVSGSLQKGICVKTTQIPLLSQLADLSAGPCHRLFAGSH